MAPAAAQHSSSFPESRRLLAQRDLHEVPDDMTGFPEFYETRKVRMWERREMLLGV